MKRFLTAGLLVIAFLVLLFLVAIAQSAEIDEVRGAIERQGAQWVVEENEITALPPEERAMRLGALPYEGELTSTEISEPLAAVKGFLPSALDWRNNGGNFVTAVRDQGNCGSCWAFSVVGALESRALITFDIPNTQIDLSEQIVLSCSGAGSCAGGYNSEASAFLYTDGTGKEGAYPYIAKNGNCANANPNWRILPYQISGYDQRGNSDVETLKWLIYTYGPISATFGVYYDFYYYHSGVYQRTSNSWAGGHAIVVVGYKDSNSNPNWGGGYFIVKNSWGPYWGESGFFRIAYSEVDNNCTYNYPYGVCFGKWGGNPAIGYSDVLPVKLEILTPQPLESIPAGETYMVTWISPNMSGVFRVHYTLDNGVTWKLIGKGLTETQVSWNVPVFKKNRTVKIRVTEAYSGKVISSDIHKFTVLKYVP